MDVSPAAASAYQPQDGQKSDGFQAFGKNGFTFFDFLDVINPLQHIPLVNTAYRALTGDEIDPGSKVLGGSLFGGPIGGAVAVADVAIEYNTGKDVGEHALALLETDENEQMAALETPANPRVAKQSNALRFAPGPGVEISRWAASAGTGGIDWRGTLRSEWDNANPGAPQIAEATQPVKMDKQPVQPAPNPVHQSNMAALQALTADLRQINAAQMVTRYGQPAQKAKPAETNHTASLYKAQTPAKDSAGMGWFSQKMKAGLEKYHTAGQLKAPLRAGNS